MASWKPIRSHKRIWESIKKKIINKYNDHIFKIDCSVNKKKITNLISPKSLKNFLYINSLLIFIGLTHYEMTSDNESYLSLYMFNLIKNYSLLYMVTASTNTKKRISPVQPEEKYLGEFQVNVLSSTAIDTMTLICAQQMTTPIIFLADLVLFIPISFGFEIIFDFFHYWTHRLVHENKYLYGLVHKKHHTHKHPSPIITFYQSPLDLVITNFSPTMITMLILPEMSYFTFVIISTYKSFVEISGHLGKKMAPTSSFSQFIWLPKLLGIETYTEDHDFHHTQTNCNYSKRFKLWDKLFGTYKPSPTP